MKDFISAVCGGFFALLSYTLFAYANGLVLYADQREDKAKCEESIKRSEQCVPSMLWLPEAR
jgi:hypothetical protein